MTAPARSLWGAVALSGGVHAAMLLGLGEPLPPVPSDGRRPEAPATVLAVCTFEEPSPLVQEEPVRPQPPPTPQPPTPQPPTQVPPPKPDPVAERRLPQGRPTRIPAELEPLPPAAYDIPAESAETARAARPPRTWEPARSAQSSRPPAAVMDRYLAGLVRRLQRNLRYPPEGRRRRATGTVRLSFSLDERGRPGAVTVAHSSCHDGLDEAACDCLRRSAPFPPPPRGSTLPLTLTVPVTFTLNETRP